MKRTKPAAHENHERWLVSYADFITLLFAFFVVMFASTQADKAKARQVSESVREALEHGELTTVLSAVLGKAKHPDNGTPAGARPDAVASRAAPEQLPPPADLAESAVTLQKALAVELAGGKVAVRLEGRGLVISLREAGFFASGDDTVSPSSLPTLEKIASVVAALPNPVRLEGHTDALPIHNSRFRSNWELSSARAISTLETLAERYRIPRSRMAVAGYAENAPSDSNDTESGRAHNRRVDIVLLTRAGMRSEPAEAPATPAGSAGTQQPAAKGTRK